MGFGTLPFDSWVFAKSILEDQGAGSDSHGIVSRVANLLSQGMLHLRVAELWGEYNPVPMLGNADDLVYAMNLPNGDGSGFDTWLAAESYTSMWAASYQPGGLVLPWGLSVPIRREARTVHSGNAQEDWYVAQDRLAEKVITVAARHHLREHSELVKN